MFNQTVINYINSFEYNQSNPPIPAWVKGNFLRHVLHVRGKNLDQDAYTKQKAAPLSVDFVHELLVNPGVPRHDTHRTVRAQFNTQKRPPILRSTLWVDSIRPQVVRVHLKVSLYMTRCTLRVTFLQIFSSSPSSKGTHESVPIGESAHCVRPYFYFKGAL